MASYITNFSPIVSSQSPWSSYRPVTSNNGSIAITPGVNPRFQSPTFYSPTPTPTVSIFIGMLKLSVGFKSHCIKQIAIFLQT